MKILDPGHWFELVMLDHPDTDAAAYLRFVKREGPKYPRNVGHYPGTTCQEVLRALISRCEYINAQIPCAETQAVLGNLRSALLLFEIRAKRVKGQNLNYESLTEIERATCCLICGHVKCSEHL